MRLYGAGVERIGAGIEQAPQTPVCELEVMPDEEYALQLCRWNHTAEAYPADTCVHELFEQQARQTPQAIALIQMRNGSATHS